MFARRPVSRLVYLGDVSPQVLIGMLVVASIAMWLRKRSWTTVLRGPASFAAIGAAAGLIGLVVSVMIGTPVVEQATDQAVQWSSNPIVRGSPQTFVILAILVSVSALVTELALRGCLLVWLLERRLTVVPAILAAAFVDALVVSGDVTARIGAGVFGIAMGWMFIASGRSALPALCARLTFSVGALGLEALQTVG